MALTFEPIRMDLQQAYQQRFKESDVPASDYSFINLWGWAEEYGLNWAWTEHLTWIRQSRPHPHYWAPVGNWRAIDWQACLAQAPIRDAEFIRVPEALSQTWQAEMKDRIRIEETRGQWDYLYAIQDLVSLSGNRYHKKKNLVNQFSTAYHYRYLPFGPEMVERALAMQADWCTWKDCEASDTLAAENRVITRVLNRWNDFPGLTGGALLVEEEMVSYTIAEPLSGESIVIHFEKGNPEYKGSYQAINQMFLSQLKGQYKWVNREQDIDDPGLRKAKLSYHPVDFIRKNRVLVS
jgi:uncharacterized protein